MAAHDARQAAERELQRAEDGARRAVEGLLDRNGCRISAALAGEIHTVYTGHFYLRPRPSTVYCRTHTTTRMPCGMCPPGV